MKVAKRATSTTRCSCIRSWWVAWLYLWLSACSLCWPEKHWSSPSWRWPCPPSWVWKSCSATKEAVATSTLLTEAAADITVEAYPANRFPRQTWRTVRTCQSTTNPSGAPRPTRSLCDDWLHNTTFTSDYVRKTNDYYLLTDGI